jgi:serine/threonine-protein kinase
MIDALDALRSGLVPHYTVEREIGVGGMARVYLGVERHPHRKVAIKVMDPEMSTPAFRRRFVREIELTSSLTHPNIVPILKAEECLFVPDGPDGLCYYIMPYIEGESLRERILRDRRLAVRDALGIALQVADALSYAHARGVIHRDVKPENILVDGERALLADFGIARAVSAARASSVTLPGERIGTLAYMSPEQLEADPVIDARADIYGLACVLHEMLLGAPPLLDRTKSAIKGPAVLAERLRELGISRKAARLLGTGICRALEPEPAARFSAVDEFSGALRQALAASPVESTGARRSNLVLIGTAALMVIVIGLFLLLRRGPELNQRRVVVASFTDLSTDSTLPPLGPTVAGWVTQGVARDPSLEVVSEPLAGGQLGRGLVRALARRTKAATVVQGSYYRDGDSVRFQFQVLDGRKGTVRRALEPIAAPITAPLQAADPVRTRIGALFDTLFVRRPDR